VRRVEDRREANDGGRGEAAGFSYLKAATEPLSLIGGS
jgi:hypothetical protein